MSRGWILPAVLVSAALASTLPITLTHEHHAAASCQLSQPVYSPDYQYEGTWTDTLASGRQVTLPDGDRAACANGVMTLLGHDGTVYHATDTTRPPTCAELAAEYGDGQFCQH